MRSQNIEPVRLTRKILRNKYLAQDAEIAAMPFACGDDRMFGLWMTSGDVTGIKDLAVENSGTKNCGSVSAAIRVGVELTKVLAGRKKCPGQSPGQLAATATSYCGV